MSLKTAIGTMIGTRDSGKLLVLLLVSLPLCYKNLAAQETAVGAAELEWVERDKLSPQQLANCPRSCDGMYVETPRTYEGIELHPNDASLEVESDLTEVDGTGNTAAMIGSVELTQGWRSVEANSVKIIRDQNRIEATGDIRMREPGLLITGQTAAIDNTSGALEFEKAEFVLHELGVRGTASEVGRDESGSFYILNATYSTCEPGEDSWTLSASEILIDEDQIFATARNMVIRVGSVPILYAPWFAFPVGEGRQSGLLYPEISNSGDAGLDYAQPYYWNISPNQDMTITPRYLQKRGTAVAIEHRILGQSYYNQINLAFLSDDRGGDELSYVGEDRWRASWLNNKDFGWSDLEVDYNRVSDIEYFDDLGRPSQQINTETYLRQYAALSKSLESWDITLSALRYQRLAEDLTNSYRQLPNISFNGNYRTGDFNWQLDHQLVNFDHQQDQSFGSAPILQADEDGTWVTGQRAALDYSLSRSFQMLWGTSEAALLSFFRSYELDEALAGYSNTNPEIRANGVRLSTELNFERSVSIFDSDWIQSLQPRIQYLIIDTESQNEIPIFDTREATSSYSGLFRTNRFVGGDRVGDANQVTLGLTSHFIDPEHGHQVARFSIGQSFFLENRKVHANEIIQLGLADPDSYADDDPLRLLALESQSAIERLNRNQSDIIAETEFRLNSEWSMTTSAEVDTSNSKISRGHLNFSYLADDRLSAFHFGYQFVEETTDFIDINNDNLIQSTELFQGDTSQYDVSGHRGIGNNWTLMARLQQDVALGRAIDRLVGVRYDSCCWSVGFFWRDWLRRDEDVLVPQTDLRQDNGIFISFELKGLAGVGQGIENLLENGIPGYNRETF